MLAGYPDFFQVFEDFLRHVFGQVDQAVIALNVDATDVLAVEAGFVGDCADDIAGLHAVVVANLDAKGLEARFGRMCAVIAAWPARCVIAFFAVM